MFSKAIKSKLYLPSLMIKPTIIHLPFISEDCKTVKVSKVLTKKGHILTKGEPFLEVETEKATIELPSEFNGKVLKVLIQEGDEVRVGIPIYVLLPETISDINNSLNKLFEDFKSLEELQFFYYQLIELLDISYQNSPEEVINIIKKRIK